MRDPVLVGARPERWALVLLFGLAGLAGCVEHIELVPGLDASTACSAAHVDCAGAADCCSGTCTDGRCEQGSCRVSGDRCGSGRQCCSGRCVEGLCAAPGGCEVVGESCAESDGCCSGACALSLEGRVACQPIDGCLPSGELCTADAECCDIAAGPGACEIFDAALALGRCRAPRGCLAAGEVCGLGLDCCEGPGRSLCRPSRVPGVERCVLEVAGTTGLPEGAACASSGDCASGACVPGADGSRICVASCLAVDAECARNPDCCSGRCVEGRCARAAGCGDLGAACELDAECCSGACESNRCGAPF